VYVFGTFTMSGGARVNANNPVYLFYTTATSYCSVTIGGDFTGAPGPVAVIDLGSTIADWLGKNVLTIPAGGAIDQDVIDRFTLGSATGGPLTNYKIAAGGTLEFDP
jgi:hypothetical protein